MGDVNVIKVEGKPIEKLIEVISNGIGKLYKPKAIRKEAEAKAYEIKILEGAKADAEVNGLKVKAEAYEEITSRFLHKEIIRQQNIDNVCEIAAEQISQQSSVSEESVNKDWVTRFFNIVEDISDSEMQQLWGRILAGEVSQPKSFSFRTLELLKNLSKDEAEIFSKFAQITVYTTNCDSFVYNPDEGKYLENKFGIKFDHILLMDEVGLLVGERLALLIDDDNDGNPDEEELDTSLQYGDKVFYIIKKKKASIRELKCYFLTKAGLELSKLVQPVYDEDYILKIAQNLKNENTNVKFGDINEAGECVVNFGIDL